jgi:hypothetical protein
MSHLRRLILICAVALAACGSKDTALDGDAHPGGDGNGAIDASGDGNPGGPDAFLADAAGCDLSKPQCSNGCDDDLDGKIDGADPECTGAIDNDEGSFATGIPGDNVDPVKQDCFFDGNSGSGNDGCDIHICCILTDPNCATIYNNPPFNPASCASATTQACITNCAPLTPPGCDCFGCCTECDATGCVDIEVNPANAPACDQTTIHDPTKCPTCTKNTQCGSPCGGTTCTLCPGQDPSTLPSTCTGGATCPNGGAVCTASTDCGTSGYCSNGCCITVVN